MAILEAENLYREHNGALEDRPPILSKMHHISSHVFGFGLLGSFWQMETLYHLVAFFIMRVGSLACLYEKYHYACMIYNICAFLPLPLSIQYHSLPIFKRLRNRVMSGRPKIIYPISMSPWLVLRAHPVIHTIKETPRFGTMNDRDRTVVSHTKV